MINTWIVTDAEGGWREVTVDDVSAMFSEIACLRAELGRRDENYTTLAGRYAEATQAIVDLRAELDRLRKQDPVATVVHHNPPFGVTYKVEWHTHFRDLQDGTKLYAAPVPAAVPDEQLAATQAALKAALDFLGTVAGGSSWWDDVWPEYEAAMIAAEKEVKP